ncbi:MAG: acyl--CoA ligase [Lachnospiraceae bacterium]|nr:acyl--CoA ligase [Lachnospiraceae bacterium]
MTDRQTDRQTGELTGYPSIDKPWLKYYSKEAIEATLPECSIYEYLVQNNRDYPSDIAILYLGKKITYKELFENIDKTAAAFLKAGVKEKEIVTVALPSIPEALYCVYALNKIGAVANMIHPLAGKEETLNYLNEVKSRVAVIFDGAYTTIADDIEKTSVEQVIVASPSDSLPIALKIAYNLKVKKPQLNGKFTSWKIFIQEGYNTPVISVKKNCYEMAIISHTGGTTGEPKGVMCSDNSCNSLMWQLLCNFEYERQESSLCCLPPFVNYSLLESMMAMLAVGFTVILIPDYKPLEFDKYIKKYHPNEILSIPAYWEAILRIPKIEKIDMSCLKHVITGGEAMNKGVEDSVNELFMKCGSNAKLCTGLGSTEMMAGATLTYDDCCIQGSVGIPMVQVNCKIVDPDTTDELTYNQDGEICFSGPTLMLGYYEKKSATDDVVKVHKDGERWLHTGDIGHIDENGVIYVTGRIKRIIMTKGVDGQVTKLFPDRIEKVVSVAKSVELCCVIGVSDEKRINYPKAFVVLKAGELSSEEKKQEIISHCKDMLPEYMVPTEIEFRDDLPRTPRGKVDYRALEEQNIH